MTAPKKSSSKPAGSRKTPAAPATHAAPPVKATRAAKPSAPKKAPPTAKRAPTSAAPSAPARSRSAKAAPAAPARLKAAPVAARARTATAAVDWKNKPISEISLRNITPQTRISANFLVYELTRSELADRRGIPNNFASDQELRAAIHLAREVLQPIRDQFGSFTPNSVFRGNPLERALKNKPTTWVSTSQHSRGEACDIEIVGMSTLALANWAKDNLKAFDQIICECYDPSKGPNSGWVHISLKPPGGGENRRQLLSYIASQGKMVYVPGLRATATA